MNKKTNKNYQSLFVTEPELSVGKNTIQRGDLIKIKGEKGSTFSFWGVTTHPENKIKWVDCFYVKKSQKCGQYSYAIDRVVPIRKKIKRVARA